MTGVGYLPLPFLPLPATHAAYPVWSGSTTQTVNFQPMPKKAATKLWHRARDFDRRTRQPGSGRHGGAVGHSALQVLHSLIFDFLNFATGRLDPSYAAIARKANVCERTVANALQRLKRFGILNWIRRCEASMRDGRYVLEQGTNAYAVLPDSQWRGYSPPMDPPGPAPGTWGNHPALPSVLDQAAVEGRAGGDMKRIIQILESDPGDPLAAINARLGRAMMAANPQ